MQNVGIVILNWNWYNDTIECIESLLCNSYKNISIILVDNASRNNEWSKLKEKYWEKIIFIQNSKNLWFSWWCNVWIKKAQELGINYIMLLNNDAIAKDWFIEKLFLALKKDSKIWIIWPAITYYKSSKIWFAWWKINMLVGTAFHHLKWHDSSELEWLKYFETWYVSWCCILIKKDVLDEIWILDEEYFAYYEEVDFCYRARKKWFLSIIEPSSQIEHKKSASAWNRWSNHFSTTQAYLIARNWVLFWKKNIKWIALYWYLIANYTILPI